MRTHVLRRFPFGIIYALPLLVPLPESGLGQPHHAHGLGAFLDRVCQVQEVLRWQFEDQTLHVVNRPIDCHLWHLGHVLFVLVLAIRTGSRGFRIRPPPTALGKGRLSGLCRSSLPV